MVKLQQQRTDKWLQGTDDGGGSEYKGVVLYPVCDGGYESV